jgi:hypothetical protein
MTWISDSVKILGRDLGKESSTVSDKGPGKNSGKEAGQDKTCKTRRFHCFGGQSELKEVI